MHVETPGAVPAIRAMPQGVQRWRSGSDGVPIGAGGIEWVRAVAHVLQPRHEAHPARRDDAAPGARSSTLRSQAGAAGRDRGRAPGWSIVALIGACALAPMAWAGPALLGVGKPARFEIRGELRPTLGSADGRYIVDASARQVAAAGSGDGRFELRAVGLPDAECGPAVDDVFADGFEN